jgi:hypothetical protein
MCFLSKNGSLMSTMRASYQISACFLSNMAFLMTFMCASYQIHVCLLSKRVYEVFACVLPIKGMCASYQIHVCFLSSDVCFLSNGEHGKQDIIRFSETGILNVKYVLDT